MNPRSTLAQRHYPAFEGLYKLLFTAGWHLAPTLLFALLHNRLRRLFDRFDRLAHRFETGTLAPPRKRAKPAQTPPEEPNPEPRERPKYPGARAWLVALFPAARRYEVNWYRGAVERLLDDPETRALLAAAPGQCARILRPLCRMLGVERESVIRITRTYKPKPRKPREPKPEPHRSSSPERHRLKVPGIDGPRILNYPRNRP